MGEGTPSLCRRSLKEVCQILSFISSLRSSDNGEAFMQWMRTLLYLLSSGIEVVQRSCGLEAAISLQHCISVVTMLSWRLIESHFDWLVTTVCADIIRFWDGWFFFFFNVETFFFGTVDRSGLIGFHFNFNTRTQMGFAENACAA